MIYRFVCDSCNDFDLEVECAAFKPPQKLECTNCKVPLRRIYGCNIDTSGCQDADDIPDTQRVAYGGQANLTSGQALGIEAAHHRHNRQTRKELADGGNRGSIRKTMQIPAALHAGKIKQTGDKHYWDDPKNRNRHKSCKVD